MRLHWEWIYSYYKRVSIATLQSYSYTQEVAAHSRSDAKRPGFDPGEAWTVYMYPPYSSNRSTWDNAWNSKKCDWSLSKTSTTIINSAAVAAKKDLHRSFLAPIVSNDGALKYADENVYLYAAQLCLLVNWAALPISRLGPRVIFNC